MAPSACFAPHSTVLCVVSYRGVSFRVSFRSVLLLVSSLSLEFEAPIPRPSTMAQFIKRTTGLTGLNVLKNPREDLSNAYHRIIKVLQQMPDCAYKRYTSATVNQRLAIVKNETDPNLIEKKINNGQVEELLIQAQNELSLAKRFLNDRPWEPLVSEPPENQWKWPI